MRVSLNWIKEFTSIDSAAGELIKKIGAQLGAIDAVEELGKKYEGCTVAKVISVKKHPDADRLSVCMIDAGRAKPVQVVCGAPNVAAGQIVVWLSPGATVPNTFDKEPLVLEAREIRGVVSHGMIASAKELALGDDHTGIVVLDGNLKPGADFAKAYGLDDTIIDIENKMFTHRPDLFGMLGIARELAGIQQIPFKSPEWYREAAGLANDGRKNVLKLTVKNQVPALVPRLSAVAIKDVKVADSPVWLKARLSSVGIRPINNIVDLTNFFMLQTAQPLHAYDYDKVRTGTLGARLSKKGEKLQLLNGKEITLKDGAVVITDGQKPIGLGGIMGGAGTEVDENTRNIVLECANFDMNQTRRTAMEYGLFTDAATRFTKNQSPRQNRAVIVKAIDGILRLAGGRTASELVDDKHFDDRPITVKTDADFINLRLGLRLTAGQIKKLLEDVEFEVSAAGGKLAVGVPFWRTDIEIAEDIVEEVGRLYGYDKLPVVLPTRSLAPAEVNPTIAFKDRLRAILSAAGANEVLTYSFIHGSLMQKTGQDPKDAYQIANALSPDVQYYRLSLTPSLLDKVHQNIRAGFGKFALFEIGKAHAKSQTEDGLPKEFERLAVVFASKTTAAGAPLYHAKSYVEFLARRLNLQLRYESMEEDKFKDHRLFQQMIAVYEPKRSALVFAGEKLAGIVGEFPAGTKNSLKLPAYCAGAELFLSALQGSTAQYRPLNRFPELEQDFCLRSTIDLTYQVLADFVTRRLQELAQPHGYQFNIEPLDIFQKAADKTHKQTTWRIILWHRERTLTTDETNRLLDSLAEKAKQQLKAERI